MDIREFSKALFGSRFRLEAAAAIARAEPGVVSAADVAEGLGLKASQYGVARLELDHFAKAGLVVALARPAGQRIQEYERLPSVYWELCRELWSEQVRMSETPPAR